MHELSVTESLLTTACEYAEMNQAIRVSALNLVIGELSGIVGDSVQFYWDMVSKDTLCENAVLNIERKLAVMHCLDCANDFELDGDLTPCPACGSMHIKILSGNEFLLDSIEIEK